MASYSEISVSTLSRLVGTPDCPVLIDVRTDEDFNADPTLIPSAYRHPFSKVVDLADALKNKAVVVYCQKGHRICVTETKVTLFRSKTSTSRAKSASDRLRRSIL